ncbi:MAG: hypothetical protein IJ106_03630 [Parasporobacterium sp.]|nr:hypothetical protein [Parasporobacterium sp.]
MAKVIKWTNKFSKEEGYVKGIVRAEGHFENTYDAAEAKTFSRACDVSRAMNTLEAIGECENNEFEVVEL